MEVRIKASLGDEMRRFRVPQAAAGDWPAFEAQVRSLFNIPGPMRIMYKDSDGDSVLMSSATELSEAMNDALAFGDTLRITVESAGGQQPPAPAAVPSAPRFDPTVFDPSADTLDASSPAAAAAAGGAPSSSSRSDPQQDQPTPAPTSGNSAGAGGAPPPFNAPPELQNLFRMVMPYVMEGCSHAAQAIAAEVAAHAPPVAHAPGSATAQGTAAPGATNQPPTSVPRTAAPEEEAELYPPPSPTRTTTQGTSAGNTNASAQQQGSNNNNNTEERYVHWGVECDYCHSAVVGKRYRCNTCQNSDLCEDCHALFLQQERCVDPARPVHNPTHTFAFVPHPMSFLPPGASAQVQQFVDNLPQMIGGFMSRLNEHMGQYQNAGQGTTTAPTAAPQPQANNPAPAPQANTGASGSGTAAGQPAPPPAASAQPSQPHPHPHPHAHPHHRPQWPPGNAPGYNPWQQFGAGAPGNGGNAFNWPPLGNRGYGTYGPWWTLQDHGRQFPYGPNNGQ